MQPIKKKCDHFEIFREKLSDLYMSDVLFIWFKDSKATRNYCILGKKIKNKIGFNATYFAQCFGKLSMYIKRGLGLEEKSVTSCPH